ncbi:hypothetical protein OIU77_016967 [Salix suchowensis]|uniref:Uncharacterized protein n=1 Tax=Salix suchowensis TaxID=1278906 RepID=A0ABQ8ZM85_9ROSI|nr:hypothetical protein OIU77_016967 [Salix suchowensis]
MRVLTKAEFSRGMREDEGKGSLNGSQASKEENGSKMMLLPRRLLNKLGIIAMISLSFALLLFPFYLKRGLCWWWCVWLNAENYRCESLVFLV